MPNINFNNGWTDVWVGGAAGIPGRMAQQPNGWQVSARPISTALLSAGAFPGDDYPILETIKTIPEAKHVRSIDLPANQQLGGSDALILDGDCVYKVFSNYEPYSFTMRTTLAADVTGAKPGDIVDVEVYVRTHFNPYNPNGGPMGDGSLGACRWRTVANGNGGTWYTYKLNVDDRVYEVSPISAIADSNGDVKLTIDLESASAAGIDYFVGLVTYDVIPQEQEHPEPIGCFGTPRVEYERTYLLFPPLNRVSHSEVRELLDRLMPEILANGWTFGFSADDAGMGDLNKRNVIVLSVHPDDWDRKVISDFFEFNYPETHLSFRNMFVLPHFPIGTDLYPPAAWYVPTSQLFTSQHRGIDINLDVSPWGDVERGLPVMAILPGVVHYVTDDWSGVGMMVVKHVIGGVPYYVQYAHQDIEGWGIGDAVDSGQILGHIANWQGGDGGDHLHFGVSTQPVERQYLNFAGWINPVAFLKDVVGLEPTLVDAMVRKGDTAPPLPPDPEPEPPVPPVVPTVSLRTNNSICLHSGEPQPYWDTYWVNSGANAMKVFSLGFAMEARRLVPDKRAVVLWRKHSDYLSVDTNPQLLVDRYSEEIATHCRNTGQSEEFVVDAVTAVESLNEQIPTYAPDQLRKAVAYDVGFAELLHQRYGDGLRPALLCGAIGNPHESEVPLLLPAARAAHTYGGFVCYHAYWTADSTRNYLTDYWSIHAGRWMEWDRVFSAAGVCPRYLLSEGGIVYAPGGLNFNSGRGWRSCGSFDKYLAQMDVFNSLVKSWNQGHTNRCTGLTVFSYGNWGWNDFDLGSGNVNNMVDYSNNWK